MPKKALYLCCIAEPWISVAKQLENRGIHAQYFVHWNHDKAIFLEAFAEQCHLQTLEDAWKGLGFPDNLKPKALDEAEFKELAWYELNALKMMDRLDPLGNQFGFQERRYFFQDLIGYWLAYIESYGLDVVISPSIPHRVFDYALYVACRMKGIRFLMFQMVPFGSTTVIIEDIDSIGDEFIFKLDADVEGKPSQRILKEIESARKDYSLAIPSYMVDHENNQKITAKKVFSAFVKPFVKLLLSFFWSKSQPNTYWVKRGRLPATSNYTWFSFYSAQVFRALKVLGMKRQYEKLVSKSIPRKFILFALHYQPEETSCPTGGSYSDQISILKILDEVLPKDVSIVVKEHKSQFYTHQEGASGRDGSFYQRLQRQSSDRITFVSVDANPFELIDAAIATATISGTIGWESAIRGTPVLAFGRAWYEKMPRVYKIKSKSDLVSVLPELEVVKNKNLDLDMLKYHHEFEKRLILAKHYSAFLKNKDVSMSESAENLESAISRVLSLRPRSLKC